MIGLDDDIQGAAREQFLAKRISEILEKHYPEHFWAVNVDINGGVAVVYNLRLSGNWGFVLHLNNIEVGHKTFARLVMQSGGELLERYRLRRGRYCIDEYSQLHHDHAGRIVAEL